MYKAIFLGLLSLMYGISEAHSSTCCSSFPKANSYQTTCCSSGTDSLFDIKYEIGTHFSYMHLKFDGPDSIDGYVGGLCLNADLYNCYFTPRIEFVGTWDTNYLRGDPCQKSSLEEYLVSLKFASHPIQCCRISLQPYIGIGWDNLCNKQLPSSALLTYDYTKWFVPVGISMSFNPTKATNLGVKFEWRPDVYSKLSIDGNKVHNRRKQAFHVELPVNFELTMLCKNINFQISPFYDWTQFGSSKEKTPFGEPTKTPSTICWNIGLKTTVKLCF